MMAGAGGEYKKLALIPAAPKPLRDTSESRFWKGLKVSSTDRHSAAVTHIQFHPVTSDCLVTASSRLTAYSKAPQGTPAAWKKTFTKFKDTAFSAGYRHDGRLVVCGTGDSKVQVFDSATRDLLRIMTGHTAAVRAAKFLEDPTRVITGSDDGLAKLWDIGTGECVGTYSGHTDHVRAVCPGPSVETSLTGSYDHTVRLWDSRLNGVASMTMSHGAPVEALLMNAAGTLLVSAGLNMVKVWDVVGGKVLHSVSMHNKTVTCLAFGRSGTRLLTGSLDQQIKVHDLATMDVVHTMRFDEPILAMGVSKQSTHLAVGHPSGNLVIRALSAKAAAAAEGAPAEASARGGTAGAPAAVRFIDRSAVSAPSGLEAADQAISRATTASASAARREDDLNVESKRRVRLQAYDRFLRKFQFHAALDASLATKDPVVVCSMLDELTQRRVVHSALQGRNEESLLPILIFLNRYIVNPRYSTLLFKITNSVLDLYESEIGSSPAVDEQIVKLHQRIYSEVLLQRQLQSLQGSLDMIMAGASF